MAEWSTWMGTDFAKKKTAENALKKSVKNLKYTEAQTRIVKGTKDLPYRAEFRLRLK